MTKNIIIVALALLCLVLGFFALNYYTYYQKQGGMESAMHQMTGSLEGLAGDAFDEAFLTEMIVHHEGAVEMAEMVLERSARPELRALAEAIISAQTSEIAQMQAWHRQWFPESSHDGHPQ